MSNQIELIINEKCYYPITKVDNVYCGEACVTEPISIIREDLKDLVIRSIKIKICYEDNVKRIYFNTLWDFDINNSFIVNIFLNGAILTNNKDFYFLNNEYIAINVPTKKNDRFTLEVITPISSENPSPANFNMNEKLKVNDMINKFNNLVNAYKKVGV